MSQPSILDQAIQRIRDLNKELGRDPDTDTVLISIVQIAKNIGANERSNFFSPVASAAKDMIHRLKMIKEEVEQKKENQERGVKGDAVWLAELEHEENRDENTLRVLEDLKQSIAKHSSKMEVFHKHLQAIERKIEALKSSPEQCFLPLGTVVRFNGKRPYARSLAILPEEEWKSYPAQGSIGVVTSLSHNSEWPIGVTMRRPFFDGYPQEGKFHPDYDSCITYRVDRDIVDVVEPGLLPNGEPCTSYGWIPTHKRLDYKGPEVTLYDREFEMILQADGFFWRLHDFGGTQSIECLQAYDKMEEMSWIGEPVDEYQSRVNSPKI